jgi:ferric-dicitrate binding protein FerR (iron transport regulator)
MPYFVPLIRFTVKGADQITCLACVAGAVRVQAAAVVTAAIVMTAGVSCCCLLM